MHKPHSLVSVLLRLQLGLHPLRALLQHEWLDDVTKSRVTSYIEELAVGEEKLTYMLWSFVGILKIIKQHIVKREEKKSEARGKQVMKITVINMLTESGIC